MNRTIVESALLFSSRIKARIYTLLLRNCFYTFGKGSTLLSPLRFANLRGVSIGDHTIIHRGCWIQTLADGKNGAGPALTIGNHVGIGQGSTVSAALSIVIEDHVFTGRNVFIADHGHEYTDVSKPISEQGLRKLAPVVIGRETWIGHGAVILPGATIGRHCVIGANSVVNTAIPDFSVAAGTPARVISAYDVSQGKWIKKSKDQNVQA